MAKRTVKIPSKSATVKIVVFVILPIVLAVVVFYLHRQYFFNNNFINKTILKKDMEFKYFVWDEFDSRTGSEDKDAKTYYRNGYNNYIVDSGKEHFNRDTILMLDKARDIIEKEHNSISSNRNIYFVINSAYRTDSRNKEEGGATKSAHKDKGDKAHAVDIAWSKYNSDERKVIKEALKRVGFTRFGIANTFIHADNDLTLPNPAQWTY